MAAIASFRLDPKSWYRYTKRPTLNVFPPSRQYQHYNNAIRMFVWVFLYSTYFILREFKCFCVYRSVNWVTPKTNSKRKKNNVASFFSGWIFPLLVQIISKYKTLPPIKCDVLLSPLMIKTKMRFKRRVVRYVSSVCMMSLAFVSYI